MNDYEAIWCTMRILYDGALCNIAIIQCACGCAVMTTVVAMPTVMTDDDAPWCMTMQRGYVGDVCAI